jgi:hypothetical protein
VGAREQGHALMIADILKPGLSVGYRAMRRDFGTGTLIRTIVSEVVDVDAQYVAVVNSTGRDIILVPHQNVVEIDGMSVARFAASCQPERNADGSVMKKRGRPKRWTS